MDQTRLQQEGYRPIIDTERNPVKKVTNLLKGFRSGNIEEHRRKVREFDAIIEEAVTNPGNSEAMSLDEVAQVPFEVSGFEGHPPDIYLPGEEPAFAPISREQMRLLLLRTIPSGMVPFALETFIFQFDPSPGEDEDRGPIVSTEDHDDKKRIVIKFNRDHFYTKGVPYRTKSNDPERALPRDMIGFIDPSKISVFLGQVIAKMVEPPEDWAKTVSPNFDVTFAKTKDRKLIQLAKEHFDKETRDIKTLGRIKKQWEDFVALAVTAPEKAQHYYPKAYDYFCDQMELFSVDPQRQDEGAINRLEAEIDKIGTGKLEIPNIAGMKDIRTEEEKAKSAGSHPNLAWYERWVAGINKANSHLRQVPLLNYLPIVNKLISMKIIYTMPTDPGRAEDLAADDAKIKSYMGLDMKERDEDFGERLAGRPETSERARNESRAYLIATSNKAEFAEWRIHAWLYKFSETYRKSNGTKISENDYKDLELIYDASEKAGRLGSGTLPYERAPFTSPDVQYYGRRVYDYVIKNREEYLDEVANKVRNKSVSALNAVNEKVFDQFIYAKNSYFDLDEKFSATAEGMRTQKGDLSDYLGPDMGPELAGWMGKLGISKISADARAVAIAYFDEYRTEQRQSDRFVSPRAFDIINQYGEELNKSNVDYSKKLYATPAKLLSESGDFGRIQQQEALVEGVKKNALDSIGIELSSDRFNRLIPSMAREKIMEFIGHGVGDAKTMLQAIEPYLGVWYPLTSPTMKEERDNNIAILRRNIMRVMYDPKIIEHIKEYQKAEQYRAEMLPPMHKPIRETARLIQEQPAEEIKKELFPQGIAYADLKSYQTLGVQLTPADQQRIKEAGTAAEELKPNLDPDKGVEPEAPDTSVEGDSPAKKNVRAVIVAEKLKAMDRDGRQKVVAELMETSLSSLKQQLFFPSEAMTNTTYAQRFNAWYTNPASRLFHLSSLQPLLGSLSLTIAQTESPHTQSKAIERLSATITDVTKAVNFEKSRQAAKPKQKSPPAPKATSHDEEVEEEAKKAA